MWAYTRAALLVYRASLIGSFLVVVLAAALLSATGVLLASGLSSDAAGPSSPLLVSVAGSFAGTALILVIIVVTQTFSSALRQRQRQFALLRAIGATPGQIRSMIAAEVFAVFSLAAPLGAIPGLFASRLLLPLLRENGIIPTDFELSITAWPAVGAVLVLLPTSLLAARLSARKVSRIAPVEAVAASASEASRLSPVRRISALSLLGLGFVVAFTPVLVPGTIGSATGASSAFLFIAAAAVGGPVLVGWVARKAVKASRSGPAGPAVLAAANTRGFSRRLTAAIIPLALFLALGTVQSGVNLGTVGAAGQQLREGLSVNLIISSPTGVTAANAATVGQASSVESVMASSTLPVTSKIEDDDEDLAFFNDLLWEPGSLRTVGAHAERFLHPGLTQGSLEDLGAPDTIAVSSEATLGTGKGIGDPVELRFSDGAEQTFTIAAIYSKGLGLGNFIINEQNLPEASRPARADSLLVNTTGTGAGSVGTAIGGTGLTASSVPDYAAHTVSSSAQEQQLSNVLLLVLVLFVALAAANTLVMLTGARRDEFVLLKQLGATRTQLRLMVLLEAGFVTVAALVIGTLCVLPALFGVGYGLLGGWAPAVDWPIYGGLALAVVAIALGAMGLSAWGGTRNHRQVRA